MAKHNIETKYEVGDILIGFPHRLPTCVRIDRMEVNIAKFGKDIPYTNTKIQYLASDIIGESGQTRFNENELFTKEELKEYINNFIDKLKNTDIKVL